MDTNWIRPYCLGLEWLWVLLGLLCLLTAALLAGRALRLETLEKFLSRLESAPRVCPAPVLVFGLAIPAIIVIYKWALFRAFQLLWDSGNMANVVWNAAHGYGLTGSMIGEKSYLAIHFAFTFALLAPLVRLWPSIFILIAAQGAAVGSAALGAYLLGRRLGRGPLLGWLSALLTLSSPLFHGSAISFLDNSIFAFPLFIWSAYFWETGRKGPALLLGLLLLTTSEQIPFLLFGVGLLALSKPRGRLPAFGLMAGAALLFIAEMAVIRNACGDWKEVGRYWGMFGALGGSPPEILRTALQRPWALLVELVDPPAKIWTVVRTLGSAGFLPLASGWSLAPALAAWLPQQLAGSAFDYHSLHGHYGAIVAGPLLWSAIKGLCRLHLERRGLRALPAALALAAAAAGFLTAGAFLPYDRSMPRAWASAVPHAAAYIPADAKLWCDEYLAAHFAMRRHLRALPRGPNPFFETALFDPDRVLLSAYWLRIAEPGQRKRVLDYLEERRFVRVFQEADLVVLAKP
ncbi:MAG: DUF2079 domain-containing protein [Elusimicrobia bacterium]|nr:DUF2079 domain-containing protein [Elusimicrobiota bacterium]